ncbi:hypothetical protein FisN_2Hh171 [Fistulifera solaris]|uniref:Ras GTPase-activating protein-binding protein 1 n=1 Tax=Fistulifera solaris TaxID=1519565 RepID=A0A1Z5KTW5_FISSO|nr:hypothetical protein FisN_2Hh171 [Fistulifera solaris]|eukprot:GAX29612.1 hypothetical protein FisN_2Hh171 [Fistulifera solaris]
MSGSGSSTPRGTETPPPTSEGPSPLIVGTRFVKQYYKVLSTTPDQIVRFYQPSSYLSQGVGSQQTEPAVFDKENVAQLKDRFYLAGGEEGCPLRFEFEHGAIDAQLSVNGGVLLVVTGHLVYMSSDDDEDGEDEDVFLERRKAFVHTFFLGSLVAGNKRSYYVHNDVLRFLHEDGEKPSTKIEEPSKEKATTIATETVEEVVPSDEPALVVEPEVVEEAPGGGVEESKEVLAEEETAPVAPVATQNLEIDTTLETKPTKPVVPGSWASMVARSGTSGGSSSSGPSTPVRPSTGAPKSSVKTKPKISAPAKAAPEEVAGKNAGAPRGGKRDPDFTLVIKNISDDVTEADVLDMFESFATKADAKIVGTTVSAHKGIAFVDFSSAAPVLAAVAQHGTTPFNLKGRELDIYQKTVEQKGRGGSKGRGGNKGNPSNGSAGRGGGRQQKGRGDRAGGRAERAGGKAGGRSSEQ